MGINQTYKNRALASLEGKWGTACIATLILALISGGISTAVTLPFGSESPTGMGLNGIWSLLCLPLQWGYTVYFLKLIRKEDIRYESLFDGYKDFIRTFLMEFLYCIALVIGLCLFIIPGIIPQHRLVYGTLYLEGRSSDQCYGRSDEELADYQRSQDEALLAGTQFYRLDHPQPHDPRYRLLPPVSIYGHHFRSLLRGH